MTSLRRLLASAVISAALAPSGAGVTVAVHELLDHKSSSAIDAGSLAALFHGHRHSADALDHDHALVKLTPPAKAVDRLAALQSGCESYAAVPAPDLVAVSFGLERPAVATGSGPPPGISPLRV